jgi:hypothetical protein
MNVNLLDQLQYTTHLTNFNVSFPQGFSTNINITIDLRNNANMNSLDYYNLAITNVNTNGKNWNLYLPSNIKRIAFNNTTSAMKVNLMNPTGIHLLEFNAWNTNWDFYKEFLLDIPKVDKLRIYNANINSGYLTSEVVNREDGRGLENKGIQLLEIYCYLGNQNNSFGNDNISWISKLTTCTTLSLYYLKNCTDFTFLNDMPQMEYLYLNNTGLSNIYFASKMPKLRYLYVENTEITNISYDENGNSKNTLDILKEANARENKTITNEDGSSTLVSQPLKYLYIKGTSLSEDEINNSGIRALTWSDFSY